MGALGARPRRAPGCRGLPALPPGRPLPHGGRGPGARLALAALVGARRPAGGAVKTAITKYQQEQGFTGDFVYTPGENTIVAIEPGVYIPGRFGIRIEDTFIVGKNSSTALTKASKEYTIIKLK